jgi:hypothetical protein
MSRSSKLAESQREKPPEYRAFEEALSTALSVSKPELQRHLAEAEKEKVSRYTKYKYVPAKPQS